MDQVLLTTIVAVLLSASPAQTYKNPEVHHNGNALLHIRSIDNRYKECISIPGYSPESCMKIIMNMNDTIVDEINTANRPCIQGDLENCKITQSRDIENWYDFLSDNKKVIRKSEIRTHPLQYRN